MKTGTIGKLFIAFGIFGLLYALNMSIAVTGSDVVNLQMLSDRQNILIVSGMLFISGIILFAVAKLKQTNEENTLERLHQTQSKEKTKHLFNKAVENSGHVSTKIPKLWRRIFIGFNVGWKTISIRLVFGLILGKLASTFITTLIWVIFDLHTQNHDWVLLLITVYAFGNIPTPKILEHIFILDLVLATSIAISNLMDGETPTLSLFLVLIFMLGGLFSVFIVQRKQGKKIETQ